MNPFKTPQEKTNFSDRGDSFWIVWFAIFLVVFVPLVFFLYVMTAMVSYHASVCLMAFIGAGLAVVYFAYLLRPTGHRWLVWLLPVWALPLALWGILMARLC
jgi:heme/copper-type cytochrome/quinol oxidase subunit 4